LLWDDPRWQYGAPPVGNANFAWMQHKIYHLSPTGTLGLVLSNGSLSSETSNEGQIRKNIVEADLVDCIVALPDRLFYNTGIPACLWFLARDKRNHKFRDRTYEILFIDARSLGYMLDRVHRDLADDDIQKIATTYHQWRNKDGNYEDVKGFCKSATLEDVKKHNFVLTPGRYVGIPDEEDDGVTFKEKMDKFTRELSSQLKKANELDQLIKENLKNIGFKI